MFATFQCLVIVIKLETATLYHKNKDFKSNFFIEIVRH